MTSAEKKYSFFACRYKVLISMLLLISIALVSIALWHVYANQNNQWEWDLPPGLPAPHIPKDNPMTKAKVELGRALFYENALSGNRAMSCATCHQIDHAFAQATPVSFGSTGNVLKRNALALVNTAYNSDFTWAHNGLDSIEQQMLIPLFSQSPVEMGITGLQDEVLQRFATNDYQRLFNHAYGDDKVTFDRIVRAIASFVRSLVSFNSPFDDYAYRGQDEALSESELKGLELFFSERLECFHCHGGFNFTQSSKHALQPLDMRPFHNTGLYDIDGKGAYPLSDQGLIAVTLNPNDMGRFKAPTLRNIGLSAPYMHDGSIDSLENVIAFYATGGRGAGINSPIKSQFVSGFTLSEQELNDLLAFLHSLTDLEFINKPENHAPY